MKKAVFSGVLGSLGLFGFYFLVMFLTTKSWEFPLSQFWELKFFMGPLMLGFGIQTGLWQYLRSGKLGRLGKGGLGTNAGVSGTAMVACCAHHLSDVLPAIAVSSLSFWLVNYQKPLLVVGMISNLTGILIMLRMIKKMK